MPIYSLVYAYLTKIARKMYKSTELCSVLHLLHIKKKLTSSP